jgi:hypothetical protein
MWGRRIFAGILPARASIIPVSALCALIVAVAADPVLPTGSGRR